MLSKMVNVVPEVVALYNMRAVHAGVQTSVECIQFEHFSLLQSTAAALCVCVNIFVNVCALLKMVKEHCCIV